MDIVLNNFYFYLPINFLLRKSKQRRLGNRVVRLLTNEIVFIILMRLRTTFIIVLLEGASHVFDAVFTNATLSTRFIGKVKRFQIAVVDTISNLKFKKRIVLLQEHLQNFCLDTIIYCSF